MNATPYIMVLLAAMLWGTTGTAQNFISGEAHPLTIGAFRLMIGGFSLLLFTIITKSLVIRNVSWQAVLISAASMALFQPLFFSSVQLTGIAIGTVVAIGSAPVLAGMIEWLFLKRRPDRIWSAATMMSIIGCILLFANKGAADVNVLGIAMALGAGLAFALYAIASKSVLESMEAVPAVALIFSIAAVFLIPSLFFFDISYILIPADAGIILYLGFATTSLAYILFSRGLKKIPSSSAVTLSLAEPLTASILGVLVVGEVLSGLSWAGVVLLLGGILVLTMGKKRKAEDNYELS
ncbi:EamA family transporter [Planococcus halotolerans]|uniref:EamA family transporter n=1 Tax=Planococcus halotolerans TaxID=2233542 RepID=A0A365L690_9BACL|nr:EamA family transporter [Planococcus halotolerans]RAZ80895.1 EamA family transporter [Planococcus halotolerans]